jgi:UDP-N-acetylglucosamine acyltransferase
MPKIHPTALVHASAQIADDVEIGPYCIIDSPGVHIGSGTRLIAHVHLTANVTLGADNLLYPNVAVGFEPQDRKFAQRQTSAGVSIGNHNIIREGVTIHRATQSQPTTLGDHNFLMCNTHLGHDVRVSNHCTLSNGTLLAGHVELADGVTIGGCGVVHQFCRLGRLSMLSGVAGLVQDLPPFCVSYTTRTVESLNIVGLRRAGFRESIPPLKRAFEILYRSRHTLPIAADAIEREVGDDSLCREFISFIRSSRRGITPYSSLTRAAFPIDS